MKMRVVILTVILVWASSANAETAPWACHIIDGSSRGADGVRLADVNGDGLLDITTGWEEGNLTRAYLHPGHARARSPWPAVTVGKTPKPEDAVFADLDGDGAVDVVTCSEAKRIYVSWAPKQDYLNSAAWEMVSIPAVEGISRWMFAVPIQIDGKHGLDLVVAGKKSAVAGKVAMGWLQAPGNPRDAAAWTYHGFYDMVWAMSVVAHDVDGDGDSDVIASDRKPRSKNDQANRGVLWLEKPGPEKADGTWSEHRLGVEGREVMFLDVTDLDRDGNTDILVAVKPDEVHWLRCPGDPKDTWPTVQVIRVALKPFGVGTAKGVRAGDIDGDGKLDITYSCEHADGNKRGVVWLKQVPGTNGPGWVCHDLSGPDGIKFDRIELMDVDGDGDLDLLTCEERYRPKGNKNKMGLGVFWYENPLGN